MKIGGTLVWLTDWQVAEDNLLIGVGASVDLILYPADVGWVSRLFADRLVIDWQVDTYGDATGQPSRRVLGEVAELMSVRCRQIQTTEGIVPATGEARLQPVRDTSGSWMPGAGQVSGASDDREDLYGYVLTLALAVSTIKQDVSPGSP